MGDLFGVGDLFSNTVGEGRSCSDMEVPCLGSGEDSPPDDVVLVLTAAELSSSSGRGNGRS